MDEYNELQREIAEMELKWDMEGLSASEQEQLVELYKKSDWLWEML